MSATTQRDILLNASGDIDLSQQGAQLTSGIQAVLQGVQIRLQFFKGDWFLDTTVGIPYFQQVLVKNPNTDALVPIFRNAILSTPGMKALTSLSLNFNRQARTLSVTFAGTTDFGQFDAQTIELGS